MKVRTLLVAAVMLFAFSAAAFAQGTQGASFSVASTPVTAVIANGLTERTGDVVFTITSGVSAKGTISINYSGVPITNNLQTDIVVTGCNADCSTGGSFATAPAVNTVTAASGVVVINVDAGGVVGDIIRVSGVRVAVANTGLTSLNAQVSTTVNSITAGQTVVQVISAISPAITVDSETTTINSVAPGSPADAMMIATEVFLNAFGGAQEPGSYPTGAPPANGALMVRFTLTQLPPAGMTLSFDQDILPDSTTTAAWTYCDSKGAQIEPADITSDSTPPLYIYYKLTSDSDPTTIESLPVPVHIAVEGTVVGATAIQFTATVAPIGTATVPKTHDGLIPRYTVSESATTPLINFTGSNTFMLVPYADVEFAINYDTGLAISNTTLDPGDDVLGEGMGAVAQPGSFTIYFFPKSGDPFSVDSTAAGFPDGGVLQAGKLPAGSTYVALLSGLVKAAQTANPSVDIPDDFTGYLIIGTNFTNAHGLATVSNFQTYTQASPVLIINGPRTTEKGLDN